MSFLLKLSAWALSLFLIIFAVAAGTESLLSAILIVLAALLICPPIWDLVYRKTHFSYRKTAVSVFLVGGVAAGTIAHSNTPEGRAAAAAAAVEQKKEQDIAEAQEAKLAGLKGAADRARTAQTAKLEAQKVASEDAEKATGKHCFSAWDGAVYGLKEGVKQSMRNPDSFKHASTTSRRKGELLEITMTYRGQNGFGGMNIEQIKAVMEPRSCAIVSVAESKSL